MRTKQCLVILLIDCFYFLLRLRYSRQQLQLAWLQGSFHDLKKRIKYTDTPGSIIDKMFHSYFETLNKYKKRPKFNKMLEPQFGMGELLKKMDSRFRMGSITAIEINPGFHAQLVSWYKKNGALGKNNSINFYCMDFFEHKGFKYNTIFMNPPYIPEKLFIEHILYAASILEDDGVLVTLLPTAVFHSFNLKAMNFVSELKNRYTLESVDLGNEICGYPVPVSMLTIVNIPPANFSSDYQFSMGYTDHSGF